MKRILMVLVLLAMLVVPAWADSSTATITAENTWTTPIYPKYMPENSSATLGHTVRSYNDYGVLYLYIEIGAATTVSLKPIFDFGAIGDAGDAIETYDESGMYAITCPVTGVSFVAGVETGDYGAETTVTLFK